MICLRCLQAHRRSSTVNPALRIGRDLLELISICVGVSIGYDRKEEDKSAGHRTKPSQTRKHPRKNQLHSLLQSPPQCPPSSADSKAETSKSSSSECTSSSRSAGCTTSARTSTTALTSRASGRPRNNRTRSR